MWITGVSEAPNLLMPLSRPPFEAEALPIKLPARESADAIPTR
jgi:hypothetical protein